MIYTTNQLQHNLKDLLTKAANGDEIIIRRRGERYLIAPIRDNQTPTKVPNDVPPSHANSILDW